MLKNLLVLVTGLGLAASGVAVADHNGFVYKYSFPGVPPLKISPAQKIKLDQPQSLDGKKVFTIRRENGAKGLCGYGYFYDMFRKYSAPGTMVISWRDKFTGNVDSQGRVAVRYTMKNSPRGSAGKEGHFFTPRTDWQLRSQEFTVPPETASFQFIFGFDGKKDSAMNIENITFEYAPDKVRLVSGTPGNDLPPSQWKRAAQLDGFFSPGNGQLAAARTTVKLLFDDRNLYVGFIAAEPLMTQIKAQETLRDGKVYADDCVEFYIYDPVSDLGRHFMVNSINTQYDAMLKQAQAGDPYRRHPWDGKWFSRTWKNPAGWEAVIAVPWQTLGFDKIPQGQLAINFARERATVSEISQWNIFSRLFSDINNYAPISFKNKSITRFRKIERINYIPQRERKVFREVLGPNSPKHDWRSYIWGNGYELNGYPKAVQKKYDLDTFLPFQKMLLENWAKARLSGMHIFSLWSPRVTRLTLDDYLQINKRTHIRFPLTPWIDHALLARQGAMPQGEVVKGRMNVDPIHPMAASRMERGMIIMRDLIKKQPEVANLVMYIQGLDEPCNRVKMLYSRTFNPASREWLDKFEKELKASYGFGKYALFDDYAPASAAAPFERIAFWRWWNDRLYEYVKYVTAAAQKHLPGMAYMVWNRNTCAGNDEIDVALAGRTDFTISCDPYPTSARAQFGMGRALYHTGFSVKMLRDLAPKAQISMYGQAFNYHQAVPKRNEVREWTSQALKNGLTELKWYGGGVITSDYNPELYNEVLEITRQVSELPPVTLPRETRTAIYYSDYDRWGLGDRAVHACYTIYSLLAEHINCNFRFVSRNQLDLSNIKLLYIPRMRFTDPDLTRQITDFVHNGGTAMILDPDFMKYNIDGTAVAERDQLLGCKLISKANPGSYLLYKNKRMALSAVKHIKLQESNKIHAFDFAGLPADCAILCRYSDGKPAIVERKVGKGKVIFSAVMPFGVSDAAIQPEAWKTLVMDLAKSVNEKTNLDVWFFELPEVTPKTFTVQPLK